MISLKHILLFGIIRRVLPFKTGSSEHGTLIPAILPLVKDMAEAIFGHHH
jgi:hypothetical protein